MALDINSAVGQAENANAQLADYFNQMSKFLASSDGSVLPPDFATFVSTFDYSELYRMATTRASDSPSYENGAAIENIHQMIGIIREFGMRSRNKADYYNAAIGDTLNESNFYATMKVMWVNMLQGIYTEGSIS